MKKYLANARAAARVSCLVLVILAGCNLPAVEGATPGINVTQAYQTVEARLTEAIAQTPRATDTEPPRPTETQAPVTASPTEPQVTSTPVSTNAPDALCDLALAGVDIDVTIPDDTELAPGEEFTKTWRLQNAGTCTWTTDYALAWFSGEQLDAPLTLPLSEQVPPGATVDLSVDMKAPATDGSYQSNWKISNPSEELFGIGPSGESAFWVRIVVVQSSTATDNPITTPETPAPTATPVIQVSGPATLQPGDLYDMDNNLVNSGGEDISYEEADQDHLLAPVGDAALTLFGGTEPTLAECQSLELSSDPLLVDDLVGNYLCYRTNMALPGHLYLSGIDPDTDALQVEIVTWAIP